MSPIEQKNLQAEVNSLREELFNLRNDYESYSDHMRIKIGQVHYCLMGTDYEANGGGLVKKVSRHSVEITKLNKWKTRTTAIMTTLSTLFTAAAAYFALFKK